MNISNSYQNINFQAKFVDNKTLTQISDYAFEHNKFDRFNESIRNIDKIRKDSLLKMDICYTGEFPTVVFSRIEKKWDFVNNMPTDKYVLKKQTEFISDKKMNPVKFAFEKLIKLGNNAPDNKMFQAVVIEKETAKKRAFLFPADIDV